MSLPLLALAGCSVKRYPPQLTCTGACLCSLSSPSQNLAKSWTCALSRLLLSGWWWPLWKAHTSVRQRCWVGVDKEGAGVAGWSHLTFGPQHSPPSQGGLHWLCAGVRRCCPTILQVALAVWVGEAGSMAASCSQSRHLLTRQQSNQQLTCCCRSQSKTKAGCYKRPRMCLRPVVLQPAAWTLGRRLASCRQHAQPTDTKRACTTHSCSKGEWARTAHLTCLGHLWTGHKHGQRAA